MRWTRLDIPCPPPLTDLVAAIILSETGRGPSIASGLAEDTAQAYVPHAEAERSRARLAARLAAAGGELAACAARMVAVPLAETDWEMAWREHFKAFRVSDRLVVRPPWEPWPPRDDPTAARDTDVVLEIEPGHAFGTGSHPTTRLALQALDRIVRPGMTVIDVGCGSGILSLAALELGAGRVIALDVDPAAVECTAQALERHIRRGAALVLEADGLSALGTTADLIVANITAELVVKVGESVPPLLRPGGRYVATGLLETAADSVAVVLSAAGLFRERTDLLEGWACLTFRG